MIVFDVLNFLRKLLWQAIDAVVTACGGDPRTRSEARERAADAVIRVISASGVSVL